MTTATMTAQPKPQAPIPPDFAIALAETSFETLQDWLTHAGAPAEVVALLRANAELDFYQLMLADSKYHDEIAKSGIAQTAIEAVRAIGALGGAFNGAGSMGISHVKENAEAWAASLRATTDN